MIYIDLIQATFDLTLTLGDEDTNNPPPLLLSFNRAGTNKSGSTILPTLGMIPGDSYVTFVDIPTSILPESGQWDYSVYDNTVPATPVLIESGLLIGLAAPITKKQYGTDKERGEYKGHL